MLDRDSLLAALQHELDRRLDGARIVSVNVQPDVADEGEDEILMIEVVFSAPRQRLDGATTSALARVVRDVLRQQDEERMPVPSFIANDEVRGGTAATA